MKTALKKLFDSCKGGIDITSVVVDVVLVTALIPVIVTFINNAENLTTTVFNNFKILLEVERQLC